MIVKTNQTAIDVSFDISGSLAGFPTLLSQLDAGVRVGFDDLPEPWEDVTDIGQTWTPDLENETVDVTLNVYNASALSKSPFGTDIIGLEDAITWGETNLPLLLAETDIPHFEPFEDTVPETVKYDVNVNQTPVDVTFDLSGSIAGLPLLLDDLPDGDRIGFDSMPEIWEDTNTVGQTWTPNLQQQAFEFTLPVYNLLSVQKARYGTDILNLVNSITWGNDFLADVSSGGDYLIDDDFDFITDDFDNYLTT